MAVINKHSKINLDTNFEEKHKELFKVFSDNNLDVEINDDFEGLKSHLTSLPKDDYPYEFDGTFKSISDSTNAFALLLKLGDTIVSTYAAMKIDYSNFVRNMKTYFVTKNPSISVPDQVNSRFFFI